MDGIGNLRKLYRIALGILDKMRNKCGFCRLCMPILLDLAASIGMPDLGSRDWKSRVIAELARISVRHRSIVR